MICFVSVSISRILTLTLLPIATNASILFTNLEEISEMIVQKQLGYNNKPLVILNTNNFYKNLILFFEDTINNRFAIPDSRNLYFIANTVDEAISYIQNYIAPTEQASKYVLK